MLNKKSGLREQEECLEKNRKKVADGHVFFTDKGPATLGDSKDVRWQQFQQGADWLNILSMIQEEYVLGL